MKNVLLKSLLCCLVIGQMQADFDETINALGRGALWATAGFVGSAVGTFVGYGVVKDSFRFADNAESGGHQTQAVLAGTYAAGVASTYLLKRFLGTNDQASTVGLCLGASIIPVCVGYGLWQDRPSNLTAAQIRYKRDGIVNRHMRNADIFTVQNLQVQELVDREQKARRTGDWSEVQIGEDRDGIGRVAAFWMLLTPVQREQYVTDATVRYNITQFLDFYNQYLANLSSEEIRRDYPGRYQGVVVYRHELLGTGLIAD